MIVMKFGGTSVATAERILAVADIVAAQRERTPVVVVSALAGVTDLLTRALKHAHAGELAPLEPLLADLERRHRWAISGGIEEADRRHRLTLEMDALFDDLRERLRSLRILREGTPRLRDEILAFGETLSSMIVSSVFQDRGLPARCFDPRTLMPTDAAFGAAQPDLARCVTAVGRHLLPGLAQGQIPVVGGFVGSAPGGETTTLGRGGSDTSAAVLGAAVEAEEIQIWSDVDGMMTADPRRVPGARALAQVSFVEAAELALYGAKVLHPASLAPALDRSIAVRILNALDPSAPGTRLVRERDEAPTGRVVSVASRSGVRTVRITPPGLRLDAEFLPRVAAALRDAGLTPGLCVASEVAVTAIVDADTDLGVLRELLDERTTIQADDDRAIISLVGAGLTQCAQGCAEVLEQLAVLGPQWLGLGASGNSVTAVIGNDQLDDAVRRLHRAFFETEAS